MDTKSASSLQEIKQHLGMNRPQSVIVEEIKASLDAVPRGAMFEHGGLCSGYPLEPMPDHYYVAREFTPDRDDLRGALATALAEFEVQPLSADDVFWSRPNLCKISAIIQSTPFGVYQLSTSQDRDVYLELGIAMGLGRPFVLVKDKEADIIELAQGLDYYSVDSFLELRYELGEKVRPFMAEIVNYRSQALPPSGSQKTAFIAHGGIDVIDFCVPIAKIMTTYGLTPVFVDDPTGKLTHFLDLEDITYQIVGGTGQTRLSETIDAIRKARLGVYRIDPTGAVDTFLALGISMSLNRPGFLVHKTNTAPPADLRGLSTLTFKGYTDLAKSFPERFGHLLRRYS